MKNITGLGSSTLDFTGNWLVCTLKMKKCTHTLTPTSTLSLNTGRCRYISR